MFLGLCEEAGGKEEGGDDAFHGSVIRFMSIKITLNIGKSVANINRIIFLDNNIEFLINLNLRLLTEYSFSRFKTNY